MLHIFHSDYFWHDCLSIHKKITCVTININNIISWKVLHSSDTKLSFHLPRVSVIGIHQCGKERCDVFKCRRNLHDVLWKRDYAEQVVFIFSHQIQSLYYGNNRYVSIEKNSLYHFSTSHHSSPLLASDYVLCHAVFHYLCLMAGNSTPQSRPHTVNSWLNCCRTENYCLAKMITLWENTDSCAEQYQCATEFYLL